MSKEIMIKNIKMLCAENNITTAQLEKRLGFGAGLISRWDKSDPSLSKIVDIADYFNITIDELVGREVREDNLTVILLNQIYNDTINNNIEWKAVMPFDNPPELDPSLYSKDWAEKVECYYSPYENGYFILQVRYDRYEDIITEDRVFSFYVQSDCDTDPIMECEDEDLLKPLWNVLRPKFFGKLPEQKAEDLEKSFINSRMNKIDNMKLPDNNQIEEFMKLISNPRIKEYNKLLSDSSFAYFLRLATYYQALCSHDDK